MRTTSISRKTGETDIQLNWNLDDSVAGSISSGNAFLDHMLNLWQVHSGTSLSLRCDGDVEVDMHHSAEDIAIALGQGLLEALGDKQGIERYGFYYVPMDEALARVCLDFSGRYGFHFNVSLPALEVGGLPMSLWKHFFSSLAENARMNLHIDLIRGEDGHHAIEGIFKALARAMAMAISPSQRIKGVPSSKGTL
jgi:imidazoleglycerol-phosphate dehydratase